MNSDWIIRNNELNNESIIANGNRMLIGNGYMGYRGTLEEHGAKELSALNVPGLYDRVGDKWREPVNAPNPFYIVTKNQSGTDKSEKILRHEQYLDFRYGIFGRETEFADYVIKSRRFVSMERLNLLCCEYEIIAKNSGKILVEAGISRDIWDINGPHLKNYKIEAESGNCAMRGVINVSSVTEEKNIPLEVAEIITLDFEPQSVRRSAAEESLFDYVIAAEAGKTYTFRLFASVFSGKDLDYATGKALGFLRGITLDFEALLAEHKKTWDGLWDLCDIEIHGDDEAQYAMRYSLYHLLIIAPRHTENQSIPARGLSGQVYKGAVFWDTEIFMLPFFIHTLPDTAKNIIKYRALTLKGAEEKASEYGCKGAFYAWESQEGGYDACSDFNVTDVFTGRGIRTYFRDKQIHISGAVVSGIWDVWKVTGDAEFLRQMSEIIMKCAEFYASYLYFNENKDRYEVLDVVGPDEYHERVNNNYYTNLAVKFTFEAAIETDKILSLGNPIINYLEKILSKLYIPSSGENGVIPQFDGYFKLEDAPLDAVRGRLLNEKEYWGTVSGVAFPTQIIKQADVILALLLFGENSEREIKRANWNYYEPRTEHGSSLSHCVYGMLACEIGLPDWAYPYFMKTARIDIEGGHKNWAGTLYIGGTHPAANAGAWNMAVLGFAGLKITDGEPAFNPRLPEKWEAISFKLNIRGKKYKVEIKKGETPKCEVM